MLAAYFLRALFFATRMNRNDNRTNRFRQNDGGLRVNINYSGQSKIPCGSLLVTKVFRSLLLELHYRR